MKLARDTWLILQYEVALLLRNPANVAVTLIQPVTFLVLFAPFLKSVMGVSQGNAYQIYVPSLFCAMGLFNGLFSGFALLAAMRQGVITRCMVTPLSRSALVLGRVFMNNLLIAFEALIVAGAAYVLGLRVPVPNLLLALVLMALMVMVGVAISYSLALLVPNENALPTLLNSISQPLSLLAGVLIPLSVAPLWIQDVAKWNPFAWGTRGMRAVFAGHIGFSVVWEAAVILGGLAVVSIYLSSRLFSREVA